MGYETALVMGTSFAAFVFAYVGLNITSRKMMPLQAIFVFFSVLLVTNLTGIMKEVVVLEGIRSAVLLNTLDWSIAIATFAFYGTVIYYLVMLSQELVVWWRSRKE